jgi:hypothetical protein
MKRPVMLLIVVVGLLVSTTAAFAKVPSGAVFTTFWDGSRVNANNFDYATDVYLDGGPGANAPADAAALPAGDYVFQVTDPSGKTLLSTDAPECRTFHVDEEGLISTVGDPSGCGHVTGYDVDHGAVTVQLYPFDDTSNAGGVYKVWVTPLEQFDPAGGKYHGFTPSGSKTDAFKVVYQGGLPD